jgi:hypothetical protein
MNHLHSKWRKFQRFKVLISNLNIKALMMNRLPLSLKNCRDCKVYKIKDQYSINQIIDNMKMKTMNLLLSIYNKSIINQDKQV